MEEIKRKLASIRVVSEIKPIEGADNIELAIIDGWQCVVKKGEFNPGNLCVYFEIDSFLPIKPEFEFLRKSSYRKMGVLEGFRLKTIKLRGQISQGLALRPEYVGDDFDNLIKKTRFNISLVGSDLTEELGVTKYEPPIPVCMAGKVKGNFPSFIRKTDLERVQNIWNQVKDCGEDFEVTVKLDGTSCTFYLNNGEFGVCSRNMDLKEDENNVYWKMAKKYNVEELLRKVGKNIALQGEVIGEGIQGNPEGVSGQEFYLFDIWDIDNGRYLSPGVRDIFCALDFDMKIPHCPYVEGFESISFNLSSNLSSIKDIQELLEFANGNSLHAKTREGVALKSMSSGLRFKVISNEYLLKHDER